MAISVVIPCHNEEESIGDVVRSVSAQRGINEVIVVDNNSTDNTPMIAQRAGARVIFEPRRGYGRALKTGFAEALGDIIVTLDGDGQYPAYVIGDMVAYLESRQIDFLSASRFPLQNRRALNRTRRWGNLFLTLVTNLLHGLALKDSQSGMWAFRRTVLEKITLESDDMALSEEIKIKVAAREKMRFAEYHIPYHIRQGTSKLSPMRHGVKNLWFLIKLALHRKR